MIWVITHASAVLTIRHVGSHVTGLDCGSLKQPAATNQLDASAWPGTVQLATLWLVHASYGCNTQHGHILHDWCRGSAHSRTQLQAAVWCIPGTSCTISTGQHSLQQ